MAALQWSETYSVGVSILDEDHKRLIEIINRANDAIAQKSSAEWLVQELKDYAHIHFAREEEMLMSANYPDIEEHQRQHGQFVEWLETVERTFRFTPGAYHLVGEAVSSYLNDWLINHILVTDMEYKDALGIVRLTGCELPNQNR